jgi:NIMA (never in mitosis gene a)-related kinase 1/4/5
LKQLIR